MVSPLWSDIILPEVPHLSHSVFEEAGVTDTWSIFPEGWTDALVRFVACHEGGLVVASTSLVAILHPGIRLSSGRKRVFE